MKRINQIEEECTECLDCGFKYIPMNEITVHLCPRCQGEEIDNLEDDAELIYEEVSFSEVEV